MQGVKFVGDGYTHCEGTCFNIQLLTIFLKFVGVVFKNIVFPYCGFTQLQEL